MFGFDDGDGIKPGDIIKYMHEETKAEAGFKIVALLGKGQYGAVYGARLEECHESLKFPEYVACKVQKILTKKELQTMKDREIMLNEKLQSKNLIHMYCAVLVQDKKRRVINLCIFFHFYNGGMLSDLIRIKEYMPEKLAAKICKQLLDGLIVMHQNNVIHRDLKPDNVVMHFDYMPHDSVVNIDFI